MGEIAECAARTRGARHGDRVITHPDARLAEARLMGAEESRAWRYAASASTDCPRLLSRLAKLCWLLARSARYSGAVRRCRVPAQPHARPFSVSVHLYGAGQRGTPGPACRPWVPRPSSSPAIVVQALRAFRFRIWPYFRASQLFKNHSRSR